MKTVRNMIYLQLTNQFCKIIINHKRIAICTCVLRTCIFNLFGRFMETWPRQPPRAFLCKRPKSTKEIETASPQSFFKKYSGYWALLILHLLLLLFACESVTKQQSMTKEKPNKNISKCSVKPLIDRLFPLAITKELTTDI